MLLLRHTVSTRRYVTVGTNGRRTLANHLTGLTCHVTPMNAPTAVENGFQLGRAYTAFFNPGTDIKEGDELLWKDKRLTVKAVFDYDARIVGHLRVFAEAEVA